MALYQAWLDFSNELDLLIFEFEKFAISVPSPISSASFNLINECSLEGLLSRTWQAWCLFCRTCIVESCVGTQDGNGNVIVAHPSAASERHVSAAAIAAKANKLNIWSGHNPSLRREPTWGDTDVLATLVSQLSPTNKLQLGSAFSSAHASAKILQLIRNASAHNNAQTFSEVIALMPSFLAYPLNHPIHALYWVDPAKSEFLIINAIEDLRDSALSAIS